MNIEVCEIVQKAGEGFSVVSAILLLISLVAVVLFDRYVVVLGISLSSVTKPKEWSNLESRQEFVLSRNIIAFASILVLSVLCVELNLFRGEFSQKSELYIQYLTAVIIIFGYFILRAATLRFLEWIYDAKDLFRSLSNSSTTSLVLLTPLVGSIMMISYLFPMLSQTVIDVLLICSVSIICILYYRYTVKVFFSSGVSKFFCFLYLCTIELLPIAVLVKASMYL